MSQRPTLDASTFEGLLAAASVLQHEQEARNHRPTPDETLAEPPETHVEPHCLSERDTADAHLIATLCELSKVDNRLPVSVPPVDGSSLLPGLADEPDSSFAYLLEDDVSTSHWGRWLVLILLFGCVAAAVWHWRPDLRDWAAEFSHRPTATQPKQLSYSAAPISTLGSEAAGAAPNAQAFTVKPASGTQLNTKPASKNDEQSAMYQNAWTPTIHKIQGPGDGVWVKTATKPSPEIPFDSLAMDTRHSSRGISSTRPTTGTSLSGRNRDEHTSDAVRAGTVAPAGDSRENPPAALSAVNAPQAASFHNSEGQTPRDAQRTMDRNKRTLSDHKIESLAGGRENAATKPSPEIPFDSLATDTRHYVPRPPPGFRSLHIAAKAALAGPRRPSAGRPPVNESTSEPVQWAMSRYVPRPPWSSSSERTSEASVPRPPARRVPRAPSGY